MTMNTSNSAKSADGTETDQSARALKLEEWPKREIVERAAAKHLKLKHSTLYADFEIGNPSRFNAAVAWLADEFEQVLSLVEVEYGNLDKE